MTAAIAPARPLKANLHLVSKEWFQVALVTYLLLTLAETIQEGFVSNFFNLNYLLAVVLLTGVAMVITEPAEGGLKQAAARAGESVTRLTHTAVRSATTRPAVDTFRAVPHTAAIDLSHAAVTPPTQPPASAATAPSPAQSTAMPAARTSRPAKRLHL